MPSFEFLDWDSQFFGFGVARITLNSADSEKLEELVDDLKVAGVKLAYWSCEPSDAVANGAALIHGGRLVDRKYVFTRSIATHQLMQHRIEAVTTKPELLSDRDHEALVGLSLQAAEYSRFRMDTEMPLGRWAELYRIWMLRSISGAMADAVLIERIEGEPAGMITTSVHAGRGSIGLFGVDEAHRGRGIGSKLLDRALSWFIASGASSVSVVTQGANAGAHRIYQRAGFTLEEISHFYHFWIKQT